MALKTETIKNFILEMDEYKPAVTFRLMDYLSKLLKSNSIKGAERKAFKKAIDVLHSVEFTFNWCNFGKLQASRKFLTQNNWGQAVLEVAQDSYAGDEKVSSSLKAIQQYW